MEPSWAEKYMARMAERGRAGRGLKPVAAPKGAELLVEIVKSYETKPNSKGGNGAPQIPLCLITGGTKYHKTVADDERKVWWEARNEDGTRSGLVHYSRMKRRQCL